LHFETTTPDYAAKKETTAGPGIEPIGLSRSKKASESLQPEYGTLSQNGYGAYMSTP